MYPKSRIDALTDGLFGVAMTILVLDVRLPDALAASDAGLVNALRDLRPRFLPYALSFYILGSTWIANIKLRSTAEFVDRRYVAWWLFYLFIATCLPFSTSVMGRFEHLRTAVWLYSVNMAALALVGYRLVVLLPELSDDEHTLDRKLSLCFMTATSLACIAFSMISPAWALWAYSLNFFEPRVSRWMSSRRTASNA
jgi:uncharacterized membrane protein